MKAKMLARGGKLMPKKRRTTWEALFAHTVLFIGLSFCTLALAYAWHRDLLFAPHFSKYTISLSVGFFACGLALFCRESWKMNLALITVSTGITVYAVETALALAGFETDDRVFAARLAGVKFDTRLKFDVVRDLRASGEDAVPSLTPGLWTQSNGFLVGGRHIFPLSGISAKTTVFCNESGTYSVYMSDEHGFNNPRGLYQFGGSDAVVIGDSFAQGFCVRPGEDIAGQLRNRSIRALNLAMAGSGPLIELAILTEYASVLRPKTVLWVYFEGNDQTNLLKEQTVPFLRRYLDDNFSQGLFDRQMEMDEDVLTPFLTEAETRERDKDQPQNATMRDTVVARILRLYHLRTRLALNTPPPAPPSPVPSLLFRTILAKAKDRVSAWGGQFFFVYLTDFTRYSTNPANHDQLYHRGEVLAIVKDLNIPLIDFHEVLGKQPDPLTVFPFRLHSHYNAEGYRLLADSIAERLSRDVLLHASFRAGLPARQAHRDPLLRGAH